MNKLLKSIAVLLVLFALMGMASADVSGVSASKTANGTNYDINVGWTGALVDPILGNFTVTIEGTAVPPFQTNSSTSHVFTDVTLAAGTYTVNVTDDSSNSGTGTFTIDSVPPTSPVVGNVHTTSDSNETHFNVSWSTWTPAGTETLELYDGSSWQDVTTVTSYLVKGNETGDTNIVFRTNDSNVHSDNTTALTVKPVGFTSTNTSDSIVWTLSNYTDYNYAVTNSTDVAVPSGNLAFDLGTGKLTASDLTANEAYTIKVRGNNSSDYSLFYTNTISTAVAPLPSFLNLTQMAADNASLFEADKETPKNPLMLENATTFNLKASADAESDFKWTLTYYDEESETDVAEKDQSKNKVLTDTFTWMPNKLGKYTLKLVVNANGSATPTETLTWNIEVTPKTTGDRIWDESLGMPSTYTWTARSFSGFYYDLNTGEGSEYMTIENIGRTIAEGDIKYETTTSNVNFALDNWTTPYQIVGFMGDKYYAGMGSDSLMKSGNLSKVLIDTDDRENYHVGQYIALEEGYSVKIEQINVDGSSARLVVEKDGKEVGSGVVNSKATFTYEKNISNTKVPFIMIYVDSVFMGTESSLVTIAGIFQVSDKLLKLESGSKIDKMEIDSVNGDTITMSSSERVSLSQDSEVTLMGKMKFIVADSGTLRFAPTIEYTDPGIYEIRGTVSDFNNSEFIISEWTPQNFEGFYYNINDDIKKSESIKIETDLSSTRRISAGELVYTANTTIVDHEYTSWGQYTVIGFMGEKYYAGTGGGLLHNGNLSKVLVDTDEKRNMYLNQSIALEEGVSVRASQINVNGSSVQLIVEKDGKQIYSEIVRSENDLNYSKKIGSGSENTTFVKVHVDSVFMGTESSIVTISGIFQASEQLTKIEDGTTYGEMEVTSVTSTGITLENDGSITLSQNNDVEFMKIGNSSMYFKVGDNDTLRFAPVVEREIGSTDPLNVRLSNSTVVSGDAVTITVEDRGVTIEGVTVTINGSTLGTTNASGQINYSTNAVGTFRVNAEKSGYTAGNASLTVNEKLVNMTVRVSPETVYFGTVGTIKATDSLNGSAVSDAQVYISGESVGRTNSSGELNYTFNKTGSMTINVVKDKYINGTTTVNIAQEVAFAYGNFSLSPDEPSAKKAVKLTFDVTNNGIKNGSHDLSLVLKDGSGNIVAQDNSTVSVDMGKSKSVSLSVKPVEQGGYTLTLVESDSNRTIDLPSGISSVSVGEAKFGSTILYIVLAVLAVIVIVVIGFVAYLFGVKGATKDNYPVVAHDVMDDIKSKFQRK